MGRPFCQNIVFTAPFFLMLLVIASCGDFQDTAPAPSSRVTIISNPAEVGMTNPSGNQESQPNFTEQNRQEVASTASVFGTDPFTPSRTVELSWDPSPGALGYKMQLKEMSTSILQIIDTGAATQQYVLLKLGEIYAFTVTAYNSSGESAPAHVVYFRLS